MIACFDAGNSRLKWGLSDGRRWWGQGALEWARMGELPALVATWPPVRRALLASVASPAAEAALAAALPGLVLERVRTSAAAAGVVNGYQQPERLGVDRWCALLGARALEQRPCLVVMAGTATTIDSLDGEGRFLGGLIMPGLAMMKAALAQGTANLPLASGAHQPFPGNTQDAIASGCLEAQVGAIERAFARLPGAACCLLSGGAAPELLPLLQLPVRSVEHLVLEGLHRLAQGAR